MPQSATKRGRVKAPSGKAEQKLPIRPKKMPTLEVDGYLSGLYAEFAQQVEHYAELTHNMLALQARVEIAEKNLRVTRDHLALCVERAKQVTIPPNWTKTLQHVQFVGVRLADACVVLLREHKRMAPEQIFHELNTRMYRFRTDTPLREIHGALLRHPFVSRDGKDWVWDEAADHTQIKLRVVAADAQADASLAETTVSSEIVKEDLEEAG